MSLRQISAPAAEIVLRLYLQYNMIQKNTGRFNPYSLKFLNFFLQSSVLSIPPPAYILTTHSGHVKLQVQRRRTTLSIGQRLKEARKARKISQDALAEKLGVSRGVITNIEHDKVEEPQALVLSAICQVLNINRQWLLDGTGSMEPKQPDGPSAKILSELYSYARELSEEELLFVLSVIKSYKKHIKHEKGL
mgnify:CR=1 FL=1